LPNTSGKFAERLRQVAAAFDRLDHARHHLAEARVLDALAQIDQPLDHRHPGAHQLLQVEAEVDQLGARDPAPAEQPRPLARRRAGDEVEAHAREALLEVDQVHRFDPSEHVLAARVDCPVAEQRHVRSEKISSCGRSDRPRA
jgi:hypothetical protein